MTRLNKIVTAGLAALAITGIAGSALAEESGSFQNRLSAATIGLPLGALPPAGLYTGLETAYLGMPNTVRSSGSFLAAPGVPAGGLRLALPAIANAIPLLYVPGWNFLGATYGISVVQAFYENTTCIASGCSGAGFFSGGTNQVMGGGFVTANTTFSPIILSWNLGGGLFASSGFTFMAPDGTKSNIASGQTTPNPDYWTLEIPFALSYLSANWNLSGNFFYDFNTQTTGNCCSGAFGTGVTSGNLFYGDLHAL